MTHKAAIRKSRKRIRNKIAKLLVDKTNAGKHVFPNRATPPEFKTLPVILVYPKTEGVSKFAESPREYKRTVTMMIEIIAVGDSKESAEDAVDEISEQVECEISRDIFLGGEADGLELGDTEMEFEAAGQKTVGALRTTFDITYYRGFPETTEKQASLSDFKRFHVDWHTGHDNDAPDLTNTEAEDDVEIPTP